MYRCKICGCSSSRGQPQLRHAVTRVLQPSSRTEIAAEVPVCAGCKRRLDRGESLEDLADEYRDVPTVALVRDTEPDPERVIL